MKALPLLVGIVAATASALSAVRAAVEEPEIAGGQYTCGQSSLFAIARLKSVKVEWPEIARTLPPRTDGTNSFAEIQRAAAGAGLHPIAVRLNRQQLSGMSPPAILHFSSADRGIQSTMAAPMAHFAVAVSWSSRGVVLLDPPRSALFIPWAAIERDWTGNAMLFPDTDKDADRVKAELATGISDRLLSYSLLGSASAVLLLLAAPWLLRKHRLFPAINGSLGRAARMVPGPTARWVSGPLLFAKANVRMLFATAVVVSMLAGGTALWLRVRWAAQPRLEAPAETLEQGFFEPGQHQVHVELRNSGGAPLRVSKIESSCSCAVAAVPNEIGPGETTQLEVVLHGSPGSRFADLFVHSNDPRGPRQITFHWTGAATPWLLVKNFVAEVHPGAEYHNTITVAYPGGCSAASPAFDRYECGYPGLKIEPNSNDQATINAPDRSHQENKVCYRDLRLTVSAPGDNEVLETKCDIFLKDQNREQKLQFQLRLTYRSERRPRPDYAAFSAESVAAIVGQRRTVELAGCDATSNLRVVSCPDWLRCAIVQRPSGPCDLSAVVVKPPKSGFESGSVVVVDEHGSRMELHASAAIAD